MSSVRSTRTRFRQFVFNHEGNWRSAGKGKRSVCPQFSTVIQERHTSICRSLCLDGVLSGCGHQISKVQASEMRQVVFCQMVVPQYVCLDFRRVVLGAARVESEQRASAKRRALRADKAKYPIKTISLDPKTGKQVGKTASAAKLTDMLKMLEALQKLKSPNATKGEKP